MFYLIINDLVILCKIVMGHNKYNNNNIIIIVHNKILQKESS